MNKSKEYYMEVAYKEAQKSYEKNEVPVGAVIVINGEIISKAHNTREKTKLATDHAEINAINKACKKLNTWRLDGADLYVTLEPCLMCAGAILQSRIKNVYYTAIDSKAGVVESVINIEKYDFCHKVKYSMLCDNDKSKILIKDFFKKLRNMKKEKNGAPETNRTSDQ